MIEVVVLKVVVVEIFNVKGFVSGLFRMVCMCVFVSERYILMSIVIIDDGMCNCYSIILV